MTKARRPQLYVILALKRKYGQLKGQSADLFEDREGIKANMAHVAAVLAMFEPDVDLASIRPIRPYKPNRGRWSRTALGILRKSDRPLRAYELARMVMLAEGLEPDRGTVFSIACGLQAMLAKLERQEIVRSFGKPRRWVVARD
jgi:hypothetical protein